MIKGNKKTVKKDLEMGRKWKNTKENARIYEKKGKRKNKEKGTNDRRELQKSKEKRRKVKNTD